MDRRVYDLGETERNVVGSDYRSAGQLRSARSVGPARSVHRTTARQQTVAPKRRGPGLRDSRPVSGRRIIAFPLSRSLKEAGRRITAHRSIASLAVLFAVPLAVIVLAFMLNSVFSARQFYANRIGVLLPTMRSRDMLLEDAPFIDEDLVPLSIDASVFEQIRRTEYIVQSGDTISEIAATYDLDPRTIMSLNSVSDVRRLLPGTSLWIPDRDGMMYAVQPGDSISSIAQAYDISPEAIIDANDIATPILQVADALFLPGALMEYDDYLLAIGDLFAWPMRRFTFTSGYGMRTDPIDGTWRMHTGIDLANAVGTPVLASRSGTVTWIEEGSALYGNFVILDHHDGFKTLYAHLSTISVSRNQYVGTSEQIGQVGNTGRSTGPHLHFSVMRGTDWVDPMAHLH
jgi:LysM repeat protein